MPRGLAPRGAPGHDRTPPPSRRERSSHHSRVDRQVRSRSVAGCDRPVVARGICDLHRARRAKGIPDDQPVQRQATRAEVEALAPCVIEARTGGETIDAICAETGLSAGTIRRILRRADVPAPVAPIPHGTPSAWLWHRCWCDQCREARTR